MSNRLIHLLSKWHAQKDNLQWVLATIVNTDGSSYRKSGAMMFINDLGQYFGLLSGGCLEADVMRQARRCWEDNKNRFVQYDMREEGDVAWQLGIGCGGMVNILLQPICVQNDFLKLPQLYHALSEQSACEYRQNLTEDYPSNHVVTLAQRPQRAQSIIAGKELIHTLLPPPHLGIFGAGIDAAPVFNLAKELGWRVSMFDPRVGYGKPEFFAQAEGNHKRAYEAENYASLLKSLDMAVVMHHSIEYDGQALNLLQHTDLKYLGLLGPAHRTDRVFEYMGISASEYSVPLANPIGLKLGGELPESIALSIVSEAHAVYESGDATSFSGYLK